MNSKRKKSKTNLFLCEDIMAMILARLPVRLLLRLKFASKSWHALISDPFFALHQHARRSPRILIYHFEPHKFLFGVYEKGRPVASPYFQMELPDALCDLEHCDDLFVVSTISWIIVCNPATGQALTLPSGSHNCLPHSFGMEQVGFAFDPVTKMYKVVRFFYRSFDIASRSYSMGFEVFDLGSDQTTWRPIEDPPYPISPRTPASIHGAVCCKIYNDLHTSKPMALLRFDLKDKKFSVIPFPPHYPSIATMSVTVLEGDCCAVFKTLDAGGGFQLDGWILLVGGRSGSTSHTWTQAFKINLLQKPRCHEVPTARHNGKILIRITDELRYYDPQSQKLEALVDLAKELQYYNPQEEQPLLKSCRACLCFGAIETMHSFGH